MQWRKLTVLTILGVFLLPGCARLPSPQASHDAALMRQVAALPPPPAPEPVGQHIPTRHHTPEEDRQALQGMIEAVYTAEAMRAADEAARELLRIQIQQTRDSIYNAINPPPVGVMPR